MNKWHSEFCWPLKFAVNAIRLKSMTFAVHERMLYIKTNHCVYITKLHSGLSFERCSTAELVFIYIIVRGSTSVTKRFTYLYFTRRLRDLKSRGNSIPITYMTTSVAKLFTPLRVEAESQRNKQMISVWSNRSRNLFASCFHLRLINFCLVAGITCLMVIAIYIFYVYILYPLR